MAATSLSRAKGNLPVATTSFIGRRREIAEVRHRLSVGRLVTLTGVGGVGKTRLALEAAGASRRAFGDGVWLVDLAQLRDGGLLAQEAIGTLGLVDRSARPPLDTLVDHLSRRQVLLVLDNCEHLLEECGRFVDRVLRSSPGVRVLATSRRSLGIAGEHLFTVPPLPVPDLQAADGTAVVDGAERYDAVRLLAERAAAVRPGFTLTGDRATGSCPGGEDLAAAVRLCARLDGLPLAIELAATRLRTLSLPELLDRLTDRFALLTGGSRAALPRQQTLRALIDWSHALCGERERLLWSRLSVFAGGFDLAAAEGVCAGDGLPARDVLDSLDALVAQSIVLPDQRDGHTWFRLLETIRQYGRERLDASGEAADLRRRHRDYYLRLAKGVVDSWCGPGQEAALARLRAEYGNLRGALEASLTDPDDCRTALELSSSLRVLWYADAFLGEGRRWLDAALARPDQPADARVTALWVAAWVCLLQGDGEAAADRLTECERLAATLGHAAVAELALAVVESLRGTAALFEGYDLDTAVERLTEAAAVQQKFGDPGNELVTLFQLSITLSHRGDRERAQAVNDRALAISAAHGERWTRSYVLWARAFDAWLTGDAGDTDEADSLIRQALAIQRGFRDAVGAGLMIELVAWIAGSRGDHARAARLLGAAGAVWDHIGTSLAAIGPSMVAHHSRCERTTRRALREPAFAAGLAAGHGLSIPQAIAEALGENSASTPGGSSRSRVGPTHANPLTRREREVAQLVARGMSNRMIASSLVLSPRTVDGHVEHILGKLGFTSRAQIATWVCEQHSAPEADPAPAARP